MRHPRQPLRQPLAAIALSLSTSSLLAGEPASGWTDLPPLPTSRQEVGVAALEDRVYVIGGILADRSATGLVERFDAAKNRWETVSPLPEGTRLHHIGATSIDGGIFSIGGLDDGFRAAASVFAFDPTAGAWTQVADLPRARGAMGVAVDGGRIYAAGGQDGSTSFRDFTAYLPDEDRWIELPEMPTARNHLAAVALSGLVYAISGRASGLRAEVEVYDPASNDWSTVSPILTPRGGIAAATLGGRIFVFGGEGNRGTASGIFPQVEAYDPAKDRWSALPDMPRPRHGVGAAVVGDRIHLPGGAEREGFDVTDHHDAFRPADLGGGDGEFLRGDANHDLAVDISDPVFTLAALFLGGAAFDCADAADANDDGTIDLTDAVFTLDFLFRGGAELPAPGTTTPGADPSPDPLACP